MSTVYGKKYEYWEQIKIMRNFARRNKGRGSSESYPKPEERVQPAAEKEAFDTDLAVEGSIAKIPYPEGEDEMSRKERTVIDAQNLQRIIPITSMMGSNKKVPIIIETADHYRFFSIQKNPEITDEQAQLVLENVAVALLRSGNELSAGEFKKRLLKTLDPYSQPGGDEKPGTDSFATRSAIYRLLTDNINNGNYYEALRTKALRN